MSNSVQVNEEKLFFYGFLLWTSQHNYACYFLSFEQIKNKKKLTTKCDERAYQLSFLCVKVQFKEYISTEIQ